MAKRDQFGGALGGHDAGNPRGADDIALGGVARLDGGQRGRRHFDRAFGRGAALCGFLVGHVDHIGRAVAVQMGEALAAHG